MNTILCDKFDKRKFSEMVGKIDPLQRELDTFNDKLQTAWNLGEDVYSQLFKPAPMLVDKAELDEEYALNHDMISAMKDMKEYNNIREYTCLDSFGSAIASTEFLESMRMKIPQEAADAVNEIAEHKKEIENIINNMVAADPLSRESAQFDIDNLKLKISKQMQELEKHSDKEDIRVAVRKSLRKAGEAVKNYKDFAYGMGIESGTMSMNAMGKNLTVYKKLIDNEKYLKLIKMIGRMKNIAISKHSSKIKHNPDEICDIEQGDDLGRMLPSEMIKIKHRLLRINFLRNYVEKSLYLYKIKSKSKEQKGPIICLIDGSGSMYGAREEWAKAFAFGMFTIAKKEKRDMHVIVFGNQNELKHEKLTGELDQALLVISYHFGGGTVFWPALVKATQIIAGDEKVVKSPVMKKADIIMITDGMCDLKEDAVKKLIAFKKGVEFRLFTVLMFSDYDECVKRISDKVIKIENLFLDEEALNLYGEI